MHLPFHLLRQILGAGAILALALSAARAKGEGTNFMEERVAQLLMEQAAAVRMSVCKAVFIPLNGDRYRLIYRVVRSGEQVPRLANAMAAAVANSAGCPR